MVYYTISNGNEESLNDYCLSQYFSHGLFTNGIDPSSNWISGPIREEFGNNYKKFFDTAEKLGMIYERSRVTGEHKWSYHILSKIPVKIIYYKADDEFTSDMKIYYDKTAGHFFDLGLIDALSGCIVAALIALGNKYEYP